MNNENWRNTLREKLGITYLFPHQELIISYILNQEEINHETRLLACLPTGSGKSICFIAPSVLIDGITICVYPLLALMSDQARRMEEMGIKSVVLKGGQGREEREEYINLLLKEEAKVLITNIETLIGLTENRSNDRLWKKVKTLVIDEVHTSIIWGNSFRHSFQQLPKIISTIQPRHLLAFTATLDKSTYLKVVDRVFCGIKPHVVRESSDRTNIFYHSIISFFPDQDLKALLKMKDNLPSVVFCSSRSDTEKVCAFLNRNGIKSLFYHAGLSGEERKKRESEFNSSSSLVLCATCAYGMGVDKKNIRSTVHLYIPSSASDFLQEAGRGGRDGRTCHSYTLLTSLEKDGLAEVFLQEKCIRYSLRKLMDEECEEESCFSCSHCVGEAYIAKGEKELLGYLKMHLVRREERMIKHLASPSLLSPSRSYMKGRRKEIRNGIKIMEAKGYVKRKGELIWLTGKGKKRLLNIRNSE